MTCIFHLSEFRQKSPKPRTYLTNYSRSVHIPRNHDKKIRHLFSRFLCLFLFPFTETAASASFQLLLHNT
ncbi:hypothetical protein BDZ45DRAFT_336210 [Acephala macrosclerotiorum]|nr:hypothetical protein BDZ45DRAFT_336210 [Acephala macrosclerotiorum]